MIGYVASLYRHPVKGFTPEQVSQVDLRAGAPFPCDRMYAVEMGPSGFDPQAPRSIPKSRFAVLANTPILAKVRTAYDEASRVFSIGLDGETPLRADLGIADGRTDLVAWLARFLPPDAVRGPMRVLDAGPVHRFMDDAAGEVSVINLDSVRELGLRLGCAVDPLRFRANLYVEGWPPWSELALAVGARLRLGAAEAEVVKPIVRCAAVHVDPVTGERDIDMVGALRSLYGHPLCGLYLNIVRGGRVRQADRAATA